VNAPERNEAGGTRLFLAAALPAFVLYLRTLAPTVTPEDSGELIAAAYTLGIAHPPGYPLWCLLGKLFTFIPLGTIAWRVNLLSAALGAASAGVLALLAARITRRFYPSLAAALIYAGSRDFWSQAVLAEVYTLNVLFFLLLLLFAFRFEDTRRTRWLYLMAFTLGLALTNHSTILALAPVFLGWVFLRHLELFRFRLLLLNLPAAFLLGFSIILYLPMRSAVDPVIDWGNPETLSAALDHFLRRQYTEAAEDRARTVLSQGKLVLSFLGTYSAQFTPFLGGLSLWGAIEHRRRDRAGFRLMLLLFVLTSYGFIWLLNSPVDRESTYLNRVFFLPAHALGTLWIAVAFRKTAEWARERFCRWPQSRAAILGTLGIIAILLPICKNFEENDESGSYLAEDWGRNILESLEPRALILPSSDHSTFPLLYLQVAEGLRPDITIADKYGYIDDRVFRELFEGAETPRVPPPLRGTPFEKERYLVEHSGRPVYLTTKAEIPGMDGHELVTWGLIFKATRKGEKPDEAEHDRLWERFRFHPGSLERRPGKFPYDLILTDYHYSRGRRALLFGRAEEALEALLEAERHGSGVKEIHNNLGGALAECGKAELAVPFLERALSLDPDYDLAAKNLASALFFLKRYREGFPWFDRALDLDPGNPVARLGKARAHKERGEPTDAYLEYMRIFRMDPRNAALRREIEEHARALFGKDSTLADLSAEAERAPPIPDPFGEEAPGPPDPLAGVPSPWNAGLPPDPSALRNPGQHRWDDPGQNGWDD
jgi:hypothetical protein